MSTTIKMPVRTHDNFGDSISKLISVLSRISGSVKMDRRVNLDFSHSKMLNPFFLCGLACVICKLEADGKTVFLNCDENLSISSYLKTIHFPKSFQFADISPHLYKYKEKTYIPIISFQTGTTDKATLAREGILTSISQLLRTQLNFSEAESQPLSYFIDELTNNINDHSQADRGFVFAQFYPNSNYLDLCICDYGIGIYQSFLNNPKFSPANDIEAMQLALSGHSTKDRPEARGFGISTTRDMLVRGLKGRIFLWSGNATFLQTINEQVILNIGKNGYFHGTFVALRLPTIISSGFKFYNFVE